jgi:hypothetical protein
MANRIAKREFEIWVRAGCPSEIKNCLRTFVASRGFKGAVGLVEKLFHHDHTLPREGKALAMDLLHSMKQEKGRQNPSKDPFTNPMVESPRLVLEPV